MMASLHRGPTKPTSGIRRGGRKRTSCLECKRLKRKCDRTWPCNHCVSRRVAHLCHFGQTRLTSSTNPPEIEQRFDSPAVVITPTTKDHCSLPEKDFADEAVGIDAASALKALGYVECDAFRSINTALCATQVAAIQPELASALREVPPRPYADMFIQAFFENVNYQYQSIHHPTFLKSYADWWSRRQVPMQDLALNDIAFTGLVLQMCAAAAQFATASTLARLELELGEAPENFSARCHHAARCVSTFIPPGEAGLVQVQTLFLGAGWLKTQAELANSWHALASAVREAQEIGLHIDSPSQIISDHEREMRRRMWYILCIWDTSISATFGRPLIINGRYSIPLPNPRIDHVVTGVDMPSAATVITLEYQLWTFLARVAPADNKMSLQSKLDFVEHWMASLPDVFSFHQADLRFDEGHPIVQFQRLKLHCTGYSARLAFIRSYLAIPRVKTFSPGNKRSVDKEEEEEEEERLGLAIDTALELMSISRNLFTFCYPDKAKYFMVPFCSFNTGSFLCSMLMGDAIDAQVPRRIEIIEAIGCALFISDKLRGLTKLGAATWSILVKLVSQLSLVDYEVRVMGYARQTGLPSSSLGTSLDSGDYTSVLEPCRQDHHAPQRKIDGKKHLESALLSNNNNNTLADEEAWAGGVDMTTLEEQINFGVSKDFWTWDEVQLAMFNVDGLNLKDGVLDQDI